MAGSGGVGGGTGGTGGVTVQIVAPASDAPTFTDRTKHILAANAPIGILDQDPNTADAQVDVVACTNSAGTATLFVGHKGDSSLVQLGSAIATAAAATGDNCPNGLGFVARFSGVTLPNSTENADGTLAAATELQVTVTSAANVTGTSPVDDVWVDTLAPSLAFASPVGLCGSFTQSATTITDDVAYTADYGLVVANVTNNGVTTSYDTPAFIGGVATFSNVAFTEGQNALVATESDPAGNATVLATCTVTIGTAPVVTFTTPTTGALLCSSTGTAPGCINDTDASTPGWQGNLTVHVTASLTNVVGSVITFTNGATTFPTATTDANGDATLTGVTIPEGAQTILATTDNVPGAGVGSGSVAVTVDSLAPNAPTGLSATVVDRRKTSMSLSWTAPSDVGGGRVTGYQVRYSKKPIGTQAEFDAASKYPYTTQPANPGDPDGIGIPTVNLAPPVSPLYIENGYYFAVEATDAAGNPGPMLASSPTRNVRLHVGPLLRGALQLDDLPVHFRHERGAWVFAKRRRRRERRWIVGRPRGNVQQRHGLPVLWNLDCGHGRAVRHLQRSGFGLWYGGGPDRRHRRRREYRHRDRRSAQREQGLHLQRPVRPGRRR